MSSEAVPKTVIVGAEVTSGLRRLFQRRLLATGNARSPIADSRAVTSLGLVSPGAATDGVIPIFPEKTDDLF